MKKDLYVKILEFGEKNSDGFNTDSVLKNEKLSLNDWESKIINQYFLHAYQNTRKYQAGGYPKLETLFILIEGDVHQQHTNPGCKYVINLDARFKYIDYKELVSAKKTSRNAIIIAIISVLLTLCGYYLTYNIYKDQKQTPIIINPKQMQEIKEMKINPSLIENKIDDVIDEQKNMINAINENKK